MQLRQAGLQTQPQRRLQPLPTRCVVAKILVLSQPASRLGRVQHQGSMRRGRWPRPPQGCQPGHLPTTQAHPQAQHRCTAQHGAGHARLPRPAPRGSGWTNQLPFHGLQPDLVARPFHLVRVKHIVLQCAYMSDPVDWCHACMLVHTWYLQANYIQLSLTIANLSQGKRNGTHERRRHPPPGRQCAGQRLLLWRRPPNLWRDHHPPLELADHRRRRLCMDGRERGGQWQPAGWQPDVPPQRQCGVYVCEEQRLGRARRSLWHHRTQGLSRGHATMHIAWDCHYVFMQPCKSVCFTTKTITNTMLCDTCMVMTST